jgi:non-ribosomal peptide synthetase component F
LTLYTLVQGAWALLLGRYTGRADVIFGATVSGRPPDLAGSDQILGMFINTVPVRLRLPGDALLLPWLQELQEHQAEMREYEYTPLAQVHAWSELPRHQPFFENILVFNNHPAATSFKEQGRSMELSAFHSVSWSNVYANYPLIMVISPGAQLTIRSIYDSSRFDDGVVTQLLADFQGVFEEITADPDRRLSEIPLASYASVPAGHFGDDADHYDFNFEL